MIQEIQIVKIGGNVIENEQELKNFITLFAALPHPKILVHGGGKKATEISSALGIETQMANGRRITDSKGLEVAIMVYAGLLNKNIVAKLQALNCNAIGLSGADGDTIQAHKRPVREIDFGYAGDVDTVNEETVRTLLNVGLTPVFCALTHNKKGQMLNTNADTIAAELAIAMSANSKVSLYYCFEKKGVLKNLQEEDSVIEHIDKKTYSKLLAEKVVADGMLPKLDNCFHALHKGVHKICLGQSSMLNPKAKKFTTITL